MGTGDGHGSEAGGKRDRWVDVDARLDEERGTMRTGERGEGNAIVDARFEIVHDDGTLVQSTGRVVAVELERGDEALGGDIEECLWFLVRIDFICQGRSVVMSRTRWPGRTILHANESDRLETG